MYKEDLYSVLIKLPKEETRYLKEVTESIAKKRGLFTKKDEFHLTIEQEINCNDGFFRVDLNDFLEQQKPINLNLGQIDQFKNQSGGVIYLTTKDKRSKHEITSLYYNIDKITKSDEENGYGHHVFVPHITLCPHVPFRMINQLIDDFSREIKPFPILVDEILVRKKINGYGWIDYDRFSLGNNRINFLN